MSEIEPTAAETEPGAHTEPGAPVEVAHREGMFGSSVGLDTTGYGGLNVPVLFPGEAARPYGSYFDTLVDNLADALSAGGSSYETAIARTVVHNGELTLFVNREELPAVATALRDDARLRFEMCVSVSGVHYPNEDGAQLHAVYQLTSLTNGYLRLRLEVTASQDDPHIPSIVAIYPSVNWHERETWDMFGIIFDGHPSLTRVLMPDDWPGHPQRKDYPLGGIPVEYKGATVPPADDRRSYK